MTDQATPEVVAVALPVGDDQVSGTVEQRFRLTEAARGPWDPASAHGGAPSALNVSLHRDPAGEWIGVRARTELDRAGTGLTTTELHDAAGRFGTATQTLFVDTR